MSHTRGIRAACALAACSLGGSAAWAADPPSSSITVPATSGETVVAEWTGTILPGGNPTSSCANVPDEASDIHALEVWVPAGAYDGLDARFAVSITWPNATNDEILTVRGPAGSLGSSDGGSNVEQVNLSNLASGSYEIMACAFASALPVTYQGKVVVTTSARNTLASAPAEGLSFSASVATENQRDESEPLVEIDGAGNIYACGPSGSSQAAEYLSVSTDGGTSFHLVGVPPRGQISSGGGGDCALAFSHTPNAEGHYDLAYAGLGPLTGFATTVSPDNGQRLATGGFDLTGGVTNAGTVADRQWVSFVSDTDVLLIYNQQVPRNTVVLRSTDKGLTYDLAGAVVGATSPRFPGPIRYNPDYGSDGLVYFAWDDSGSLNGIAGNFVMLSVSRDRGRSWNVCNVDFTVGETTLFASADHDRAGNVYVAYGDNSTFHTYARAIDAASLGKCDEPASTTASASVDGSGPGAIFGPRVQVDRDAVRSTVFPWITAGGAPGHVAVTFLGTETEGNPNLGTFKGTWDVYVNVSTNMLSDDPLDPPTFSQVKATTHPMHYDSICLEGLGCDLSVPPGDRSMADFMAIDYNPVTDRLTAVFNRTNKKPDEAGGHVATTMAVTQTGGPTLGGGTLTPAVPVLRNAAVDATGDALSAYSNLAPLVLPPSPPTRNEPAADFTAVSVGPEVEPVSGTPIPDGGFTVTFRVADLSDAALLDTALNTQSKSLLWLFRFTNGYQDVAAAARWNATDGFTFGYNDYVVGDTPCTVSAGASEKCLLYPGDMPLLGSVDQAAGEIRVSVPRWLLQGLSGPTGHNERPREVAAALGTRFYDATAWSLGNVVSARQDLQSFLYPFDSTPAFDFRLAESDEQAGSGCRITGGGAIPSGTSEGKFAVAAFSDLQGRIGYRDTDADIDFRSSSLTSVVCNGASATISGIGINDDEDQDDDGADDDGSDENRPLSFTVEVTDGGSTGSDDSFSISIDDGYARSGKLTKGNLNVHD